jgi:enterochelin esterase-like enzyme
VRTAALALLALVWAIVGVHGAFSYGNAYVTYRGFPPPKDPPGIAQGHLLHEAFWSPALHARRTYLVYTPPGYAAQAAHGRRFPVLYLLHGSPGAPRQFINVSRAGVSLDEGVVAHRLRPFLLVMPNGSDGTFRSDTEWANTPRGNYEGFVLDVVHSVDRRFATLRGRRFRALGGNSEGGYAAVNLALRHPRMFAIAESWSGYLWEDRKGAFAKASVQQLDANDPSRYIPLLGAQLRRYPLHAYLYKGTREGPVVKARLQQVAAELARAGGHVTVSIFRGGHTWRLWRDQTPRMLRYASHWFGVRT